MCLCGKKKFAESPLCNAIKYLALRLTKNQKKWLLCSKFSLKIKNKNL